MLVLIGLMKLHVVILCVGVGQRSLDRVMLDVGSSLRARYGQNKAYFSWPKGKGYWIGAEVMPQLSVRARASQIRYSLVHANRIEKNSTLL